MKKWTDALIVTVVTVAILHGGCSTYGREDEGTSPNQKPTISRSLKTPATPELSDTTEIPVANAGNTGENINNSGPACRKVTGFYYQNTADQSNLYKMKTDGTEKTKLSGDVPVYINVVED